MQHTALLHHCKCLENLFYIKDDYKEVSDNWNDTIPLDLQRQHDNGEGAIVGASIEMVEIDGISSMSLQGYVDALTNVANFIGIHHKGEATFTQQYFVVKIKRIHGIEK